MFGIYIYMLYVRVQCIYVLHRQRMSVCSSAAAAAVAADWLLAVIILLCVGSRAHSCVHISYDYVCMYCDCIYTLYACVCTKAARIVSTGKHRAL